MICESADTVVWTNNNPLAATRSGEYASQEEAVAQLEDAGSTGHGYHHFSVQSDPLRTRRKSV